MSTDSKNGLLDRLAACEGSFRELTKVVAAVARVVGMDEVNQEIWKGNREDQASFVAEMVKNKALKPGKVVGEQSFVVGSEMTKDGKLLPPGRFQAWMRDVIPEIQKLLLGLKTNGKAKLKNGNTLWITEVYETPVEEVPKAKIKRAKKPAAEPKAPAEPVN